MHLSLSFNGDMPSLFPPELILEFLENLSFPDLISAYQVNKQWRVLVPKISSSLRLRLFHLAFHLYENQDGPGFSRVTLSDRCSYVSDIESRHRVVIPDPYRVVLTEWPVSHPPPGFHWPHAVRFHANGFCSCDRSFDPIETCSCESDEVTTREIRLSEVILNKVMNGEPFDFSGSEWAQRELFFDPPRLHTQEQNEQTLRLIRAHPLESYGWLRMMPASSSWRTLRFQVLRLSAYRYFGGEDQQWLADGFYAMMLDGPTRGQIHAWSSGIWYDGFEAEDFMQWKYT